MHTHQKEKNWKLSILIYDMILHIENTMDSPKKKKILQQISDFGSFTHIKSIHKYQLHFYKCTINNLKTKNLNII
jgi:hypothetical protein